MKYFSIIFKLFITFKGGIRDNNLEGIDLRLEDK